MQAVTSLNMRENVPLAPCTTLGIGGPARYFLETASEADLRTALDWRKQQDIPAFILGGGSNLVVSDSGFPGLVIRQAAGQEPIQFLGAGMVEAGAGMDWDAFVRRCVASNLQGVECLAGIPGSVGATPVQNVGAYGQEVADTIVQVGALDRTTGNTQILSRDECRFAYRRSRFNHDEPGRWVILSVTFALKPNAPPTLKYADLKNYFADAAPPTILDVYHAVREIRSRKGMVVRADDPDSRSAGSFFKNPTVTAAEFDRIAAQAGGELPHWPQADGTVKLSAAWLIERSGFRRGETFGNAGISSKHVLALVNRGGATATELVLLARRVQSGVMDTWGVLLSPEPIFLGFGTEELLPQNAVRADANL
jgi:UDP-N-acetylmuramate dehydrogenase